MLMDVASINNLIKTKVRRNNRFYELMLDATGAGPFDGGCILFALALQRALKTGEMYMVMGSRINGDDSEPQHAVLKIGDNQYVDADGVMSSVKLFNR